MTGEETVNALEDQYGKLLAFVVRKYCRDHAVLNIDDLNKAMVGGCNIAVQELDDGLHIRVVSDQEAIKLQRQERRFNPPNEQRNHLPSA